jgi:hypothetical protein
MIVFGASLLTVSGRTALCHSDNVVVVKITVPTVLVRPLSFLIATDSSCLLSLGTMSVYIYMNRNWLGFTSIVGRRSSVMLVLGVHSTVLE